MKMIYKLHFIAKDNRTSSLWYDNMYEVVRAIDTLKLTYYSIDQEVIST